MTAAGRRVRLPYGHGAVDVELPVGNSLVLEPTAAVTGPQRDAATSALARPIGTARLRDLVAKGQKVVIVTSDMTRPCPSDVLLPPVLSELNTGGVVDADITVVVALGLHRAMTDEELRSALGDEVCCRVQVLNHDPGDTVKVGTTSRGTPVELFRPVVEADVRVCLGNVEFHYFAGFSGGAKAVLPGCASEAAVTANHALMVEPTAVAGRLEGNPLREDLEEGVAMVGVDFVLNVVVDADHQVVAAVAGDVTAAHRQACRIVREFGSVPVEAEADVVLVGAGGHPSDLNLYQAQKALDNAAAVVREGGFVIWVAECGEGFGSSVFESWLREADTPADVLARIQRRFVLGGHKAAAVAAVQQRASVYLVTAIEPDAVRACGLTPYADVASALTAALEATGPAARILALPRGQSTFPEVTGADLSPAGAGAGHG